MIAPTPGGDATDVDATDVDSAEVGSAEVDSAEARTLPADACGVTDPESVAARMLAAAAGTTPDWTSPENRARDFLERLGRADHPDAERDPLNALFQIAVDYRCSAHGYRELYLHHMRHAGD